MKPTHFTHLFLAALSVAAAMSATSCGKDSLNPDVLDLPACGFTLTASETRGTDHVLPWTISKDGKTDSLEESLDEMYVTAYNELTLNVEPSGTGFQGVWRAVLTRGAHYNPVWCQHGKEFGPERGKRFRVDSPSPFCGFCLSTRHESQHSTNIALTRHESHAAQKSRR